MEVRDVAARKAHALALCTVHLRSDQEWRSCVATRSLEVPLLRAQVDRLIRALTAKGWVVEGQNIFAPHRSIWLAVEQPWGGDLDDFLDRIRGRLRRVQGHGDMHEGFEEHAGVCRDVETLVEVLTSIADGSTPG